MMMIADSADFGVSGRAVADAVVTERSMETCPLATSCTDEQLSAVGSATGLGGGVRLVATEL
jgi:hypothetical protein